MAADLTRAELKLVEAAATGAIADYRSPQGIETANRAQWGHERTISALVIYALAVNKSGLARPSLWPADSWGQNQGRVGFHRSRNSFPACIH